MKMSKKMAKLARISKLKKDNARTSSELINRVVGGLLREARGAAKKTDEQKKTEKAERKAALAAGKPLPEPKRVNQTELALALGIDQSALSRVENGYQQLTVGQWVLLHEYKILSIDAISRVLEAMTSVELPR